MLLNIWEWGKERDGKGLTIGVDEIIFLALFPGRLNTISHISKGQQINFTLPNRSETFTAKVIKINPMLQTETATLKIHCKIEHPDKKIFVPGMFVNAEIETAPTTVEGLQLNAVIKDGEDYFAFRVQNNQVQKTALINAILTRDFIVFDNEKEVKQVAGYPLLCLSPPSR